jgi:hypothetical protein
VRYRAEAVATRGLADAARDNGGDTRCGADGGGQQRQERVQNPGHHATVECGGFAVIRGDSEFFYPADGPPKYRSVSRGKTPLSPDTGALGISWSGARTTGTACPDSTRSGTVRAPR